MCLMVKTLMTPAQATTELQWILHTLVHNVFMTKKLIENCGYSMRCFDDIVMSDLLKGL